MFAEVSQKAVFEIRAGRGTGVDLYELNQALGVADRQAAPNHGVDHREDESIGGDAGRDQEGRAEEEGWGSADLPEGEAKVLEDGSHVGFMLYQTA